MQISKTGRKIGKNVFSFSNNCVWYNSCRFQILQREYLSLVVNVLIKTLKSSNINNSEVSHGTFSQSDKKKLIKVLSWRFYNSLGFFNMFTIEGSYETGLFKHFRRGAFHNLYFRKYICSQGLLKSIIKVLSYRLHKCLWRIDMVTVEGCSETGLSKYFSNPVFHNQWKSCFFSKYW